MKCSTLVPMIYPEFKTKGIVFVGINPSFDARRIPSVLKGSTIGAKLNSPEKVQEFFTFESDRVQEQIPDLQEIQRLHHENYFYFARHRRVAELLGGMSWEQVDLFQDRISVQADLLTLLQTPFYRKCAEEQLNIFVRLLKVSDPSVIVVVNGKVSNFLKDTKTEIKPLRSRLLLPMTKKIHPDVYFTEISGRRVPVIFKAHEIWGKTKEQLEYSRKALSDLIQKAQQIST